MDAFAAPMYTYVEPRRANPVRQKFESYLRSAIKYASRKGLDMRFEVVGHMDRGLTVTEKEVRGGYRLGYSLVIQDTDGSGVPDPWFVSDLVLMALRDSVWNTPMREVEDIGSAFVLYLKDRNDGSVVHRCEVSVTARDRDGSLLYRYRDPSDGECYFDRVHGTQDYDGMVAGFHPDGEPVREIRRRCMNAMNSEPGRCTTLIYAEVIRDMFHSRTG